MKIIMGADPAGFELKNAIKEDLLKRGYEIMDIGRAGAVSGGGESSCKRCPEQRV